MVRVVGLEPTLCHQKRILSPPRLPVPPHPHGRRYSRRAAGADYNAPRPRRKRLHTLYRAGASIAVNAAQGAGLQVPNAVITSLCDTMVSEAPGSERDICRFQPTIPSTPCAVMLSPALEAD